MNRFDAQGEHGNYEFEAFDGAEYEGANFGEAEFGEGEFEDEWGGRVRDHRRADAPQTTVRVRDHRRPATVSRTSYTPTVTSRSRSYAPRSAWWGTRTNYGSRPVSRSWSGSAYRPYGQQYRWGQPGVSSQWYRSGQYPGRYRQFGQGQSYYGGTPQWGGYWGRRRSRYPYGQFGYGGSAYAQPYYDEPAEPPYEEPPMPPPQAPMPPPETPPADPNAATPPPAQAQAKAEEFFIQPEAFEFDMESPGEGESFESGFGEFESGPGTLPDPPVDKNPVNGCETRGRPFDDFEFRSAAVPAKHGPRIKELARIIVASWVTDPSLGIRTVCLEGHTDNVGTTDENMRLGLARAKNLRAKLQQAILDEANKTGFGPQIAGSVTILVSSRGKDDPVAPNTTALGRRRNRRVRFAFST